MLEQFLEQHYFKSLDMYGDETALCNFKKIFKTAKDKGLILKAHVGEFGSAELVREVMLFNQSISDEFFNLYNTGLFNATELNEIRGNVLSVIFPT